MTAIAAGAKRALRFFSFQSIELAAVVSTEYKQGSLVGFDPANSGLISLAAVGTNFEAIGTVIESVTLPAGGGSVRVRLFREVHALYFVNATAGDAVAASNVGGLAYVLDDQTVASNDATNTRSALGRIWKFDSFGVLVEPAALPTHLTTSGLDN